MSEQEEDGEQRRLVPLSVEVSSEVDIPRLLRKLHKRLLPLSLLFLIFANIDRGNLGFVANQLCRDLSLTHTEYGTGASAFFVGFLFSRIPSNLAMRYFGGPVWLTMILLSWGVLAASLAFITHVYHFYVVRFLLGIAEGGAFPGAWYFLTGFFPDEYLTFPYTITALAAPVATAMSGPLAAMFVGMDGLFGIEAWRLLFFFEGVIPAITAPVMYLFLPKSVERCHFLTPDERSWLQQKRNSHTHSQKRSFFQELKVLAQSVPYLMMNIFGIVHLMVFAIIMYWTTLMIEEVFTDEEDKDLATCASSHSTGLVAILVTALVFILSSTATLVLGLKTEKSTNRNRIAGVFTCVCGVALASWVLRDYIHHNLGLVTLTIAACSMNAPTAAIVSLLVSYFDADMKSTALSVFATVASLGALFGPIMIGAIVDHYDNYNVASIVLGTLVVAAGVLILFVKDPLKKDMQQEDKQEERNTSA